MWEGAQTAALRDGGLPVDPFGAAAGVYSATANIANGEQLDRAAEDLARRLVSTMPGFAQASPVVEPAQHADLTLVAEAWCQIATERFRAGNRAGAVEALEIAGRKYLVAGDKAGARRVLAGLNAWGDQ